MKLFNEKMEMKQPGMKDSKANHEKRIKTKWKKMFTRKNYTFWKLPNQTVIGILGSEITDTIYQVTTDGMEPKSESGYFNLSALMRLKGV